jgi:hypothetical protein
LLTSVGLLALLPYVLKQGWRFRTGNLAVDSGYASVLAAVDAFDAPLAKEPSPPGALTEDLEELLAHLFSLRMTVSEVTAEVQETRDALDSESGGEDGVKKRAVSVEEVA